MVLLTYNVYPINPIEMILTHPYLFNSIVVLFIAFTSGWLVYVISSKKIIQLKRKIKKLETEKQQAYGQIKTLQQEIEKSLSWHLDSLPVIPFSSIRKINKAN